MKPLVFAVVFLIAVTSTALASDELVGRYTPPALNAGIALTLRDDASFTVDWWAQKPKEGKIIHGSIGGSWSQIEGELVLRYVIEKKQSEAAFEVRKGQPTVLKLKRSGEFPFVDFFGEEYAKEEKPHQRQEPTPTSVTPAVGGAHH